MSAISYSAEQIAAMPPSQRAFAAQLAATYLASLPLWEPLEGPQTMAFESIADIIGYGGAAGGGKTDLALGKAIMCHRRVAVFRLNGTEHTAFVDRLEEVLGTRDGFNGKDGIWRTTIRRPGNQNCKVQIELGSVPNDGDERKYRGRPHDLKVFDEASEIPEHQIRFLMGWLRTTDPKQRCQALLCFNPPTSAEGRWIIKFFAPWLDPAHPCPALPGELRWFAMCAGEEIEMLDHRPFVVVNDKPVFEFNPKDYKPADIIKPESRTFIPAKVTDNPHLVGTNYMSKLQALPEPLRSQMLYGDFQAGIEDDALQVIPTKWVEIAMARWAEPPKRTEMLSLGCDPARGGKDNTIIMTRHAGNWYAPPLAYPGTQTPDGPMVCGLVIAASRDGTPQHIEINGIGSSPFDFLNQAKQPVYGIDVSTKSSATDKSGMLTFFNVRSEMWWKMREELDPANNTGIQLPPDARLKADLTAPKWKPEGRKIQVESRQDIVDRLKRSADWGTACCLARFDTPKVSFITAAASSQQREYDPYSGGTRDNGARPYDPYSNI